jgi:hypothetical protein
MRIPIESREFSLLRKLRKIQNNQIIEDIKKNSHGKNRRNHILYTNSEGRI